jgi:hypothetical protein
MPFVRYIISAALLLALDCQILGKESGIAVSVELKIPKKIINIPNTPEADVRFWLEGRIQNVGGKAMRFTVLDSWRLVIVTEDGAIAEAAHNRDFLKAFDKQDCPLLEPKQTLHIKVQCRISRVGGFWVWEIGDGIGGSWTTEAKPGRMKVCLIYHLQQGHSVQDIANSQFNFKPNEFWGGVGASCWRDLEFDK